MTFYLLWASCFRFFEAVNELVNQKMVMLLTSSNQKLQHLMDPLTLIH